MIGQRQEYQALKRAEQEFEKSDELREKLEVLNQLTQKLAKALEGGESPPEEEQRQYEELMAEVQGNPKYQALIAAQSNFDKVMTRVNQQISKGVEEGSSSPIITLS